MEERIYNEKTTVLCLRSICGDCVLLFEVLSAARVGT